MSMSLLPENSSAVSPVLQWSTEMITYWVIDFAAISLAGLLAMLLTTIFACELCSWLRRWR